MAEEMFVFATHKMRGVYALIAQFEYVEIDKHRATAHTNTRCLLKRLHARARLYIVDHSRSALNVHVAFHIMLQHSSSHGV